MHTILSIFISLSLLSPAFLPIASQFSVLAENETPAESGNPSPDASMPDASNPDAASDASAPVALSAPSALLMEASTGTIIYEKDAHSILHPASITKIMTLILIFDALDAQKISLDDVVTVSEHAASMGGSQVFLEPGETQTVDTMIKCISVASANDAALRQGPGIPRCVHDRSGRGHFPVRAQPHGRDEDGGRAPPVLCRHHARPEAPVHLPRESADAV